eukprot:CCRYP_008602-RC/>CCRYP_008602-RC protein AED:0.12 eAED:0.12 QI:1988/1/1/1/0.77/0.5/10/3433/466
MMALQGKARAGRKTLTSEEVASLICQKRMQLIKYPHLFYQHLKSTVPKKARRALIGIVLVTAKSVQSDARLLCWVPCFSSRMTYQKKIAIHYSVVSLTINQISLNHIMIEILFCILLPMYQDILPLGKCLSSDKSPVDDRFVNWPTVPFECDVSLQERWGAFKAILSSTTTMVTYNATVSLLPVYHHLIHDRVKGKNDHDSFNRFRSAISGESNGRQPLSPDECLYSIWDLRLVSWMLRPGVSDAELEYSYFKEGFQHLIPNFQSENHEGLTHLSRGLLEAKNDLALLNNIFPIMNRQVINNDLLPALEQIEAPVQSVLAAMECRGIAFDSSRFKKVQSQLEKRVNELEVLSREITKDPEFLLSSPQQVSNFLFDVLKLSMPAGLVSKTKAGSSHRSTSEEALKAIKAEMVARDGSAHSIIDFILEFRTLNKMLTTYILPLPAFCYREKSNDEFPRIHPHWIQTVC